MISARRSGVFGPLRVSWAIVFAAEMQVQSPFKGKGRIQHMVHLCSGDYPDFFTEIIFGKIIADEPPRWHTAFLGKVWEYSGFREYLDPIRPATGSESAQWHTVVRWFLPISIVVAVVLLAWLGVWAWRRVKARRAPVRVEE